MVERVQGVAVRCGWVYRKGRACIDMMVDEKKEGEMEGLVMRKVRERLCLIVYGRGVRWG